MSDDIELLPCPFCGGVVKVCQLHGWNHRASLVAGECIDRVRELARVLLEDRGTYLLLSELLDILEGRVGMQPQASAE